MELKTVLTHDSYIPSNNKKVYYYTYYVFLGMYGFNGDSVYFKLVQNRYRTANTTHVGRYFHSTKIIGSF